MSTTNQSKDIPKKVLITGASGLLGVAAIERFLDAGWEVVGVSRRKPELTSGRNVDFLLCPESGSRFRRLAAPRSEVLGVDIASNLVAAGTGVLRKRASCAVQVDA